MWFPSLNPSLGLIPQTSAGTNTALKHWVPREVSCCEEKAERYCSSKPNIQELLKKRVWDQVTDSGSPLFLKPDSGNI